MPSLPARPVRWCPEERRAAGSSEQPAGEDEELGNKSCYSHACFLSRDRERKANKSLPKELLGGKFHRLACFSWGNAKREWVLQGDPRGSVSAETPRVCTCVRVCVCAHGGHCLPLLAGSEKRCRSLHHHQASVELVPADPQAERPADGTGSEGGSLQMHTPNFGSLSSCCCSQLAQLSWHPASTAGTGPAVLVARSTQGRAQHLSQCPAAFRSCVTSGILLWRLG